MSFKLEYEAMIHLFGGAIIIWILKANYFLRINKT